MGVSATHLDWTMVPYVRKSFFKHYKKGLKFLHDFTDDEIKEELKDINKTEISIQNTKIYHYGGAYKYAIAMTEEEIEQSVEGLYHNLNSLQSRSGNQLAKVAE